ncbi:MAG TPA: class I SAM-dependent methyltransferase [Actinomycetes bacterium]|nr:class I SAM-dependent methyltransferase [Actinomycetes bacterium]
MDILRQHEISEASHRLLNPFSEEQLMLLGEICRLTPDHHQLDLACGKGEMLCRWAERYGMSGLGVDLSQVFLNSARERAIELGVVDRVSFQQADAAEVVLPAASFDVVSCIGATWIGGGLAGTVELMRQWLEPGGLMLIGEPFWHQAPPQDALDALGFEPDEFTSLVGTMERFEESGLELMEMVISDPNDWDRYEAAQWWTVTEWLRENPQHPDAAEMRIFLDSYKRSYLSFGRRYLGWGVFVLRSVD